MVANWTIVIDRLRADLAAKGFLLPARPTIDGRWHHGPEGGAYLIFAQIPHTALACDATARVTIWREDDRILSVAQQHRIDLARAALPALATARPGDQLVSEPARHDEAPRACNHPMFAAAEWLNCMLAGGALPSTEVRQRAGEAGIAWASVRRAARRLGVVARRSGFGPDGVWRWEAGSNDATRNDATRVE